MTRSVLVVMMATAAVKVAAADAADPKMLELPADKLKAAAELVAKLEDPDVTVRDRIAAKLKDLGREALPAMEAALKAKAANRVLDHLVVLLPDARRHELNVRARCFLADKERKYEHDLPGWNELKALVKDTKESRLLMADILNDDECRDLLVQAQEQAVGGKPVFGRWWRAKNEQWSAEYNGALRAGRPIKRRPTEDSPIQWMACGLLADLVCGKDFFSNDRHHVVLCYVGTDEGKLAAAGKGRYGPVVREFATAWVTGQAEPNGMRDAHTIATYFKLDESVVRGVLEKQFEMFATTGKAGGAAVAELADTQDPKYIASFRRLFGCSDTYRKPSSDGKLAEIQVRDVALAMCISLSGQNPMDFGFDSQDPKGKRFWVDNYRFADSDGKTADEKRTAAFKKWAEWEKANPDKIKAKPPEKKEK